MNITMVSIMYLLIQYTSCNNLFKISRLNTLLQRILAVITFYYENNIPYLEMLLYVLRLHIVAQPLALFALLEHNV